MTWNTSYGIRDVDLRKAVRLFGSAERAMQATSGDERLLLLYINNPEKVASAPPVHEYEANKYYHELRQLVRDERDEAQRSEARSVWESLPGRKTLVAVAEALGLSTKTVRKRLEAVGVYQGRKS